MSFLWGATTLGCLVIGLFFLRFWRLTRDRLFAFFAAAFWVLALNWFALATIEPAQESRHLIYVVRVIAFLILIIGILDKNRRAEPPRAM